MKPNPTPTHLHRETVSDCCGAEIEMKHRVYVGDGWEYCSKCKKLIKYLTKEEVDKWGKTSTEPRETSRVIETWKLDLERLLWSYHENGRPDGKTGVIGNPKTIEEFVIKLMNSQYNMGKEDGRAMKKRAYCEVCRVLIDADTGEREKYA